ncbi:MAG: DoxX family protein [Acidiferrobacterales bacterium]
MFSALIEFALRCLLVSPFLPFSALDKILNFNAAVDQASQAIPNRVFAILLIIGGLCIEFFMSLAILTGVADRLAALTLAGYCLITALLWKQFWTKPDFRLKGASNGRDVFWDFMKNVALAGGFFLLAFGSNGSGVQQFLYHPLASSQPYAIVRNGIQ